MRKRMKKALAVIGAMAMALTPVIGIQMQETVYAYDPETDGAPVYEYQEPTGKTYDFAITGTVVMSQVQEFVRLVNEARAAEGLQPVTLDSELQEVAELRAAHQFFNYSHVLPDGIHYYWDIGNMATKGDGGEVAQLTPMQKVNNIGRIAFQAWMASEAHKEIIMNPKQRSIGVGIVVQPITVGMPNMGNDLVTAREVAILGSGEGDGNVTFNDYENTFQIENAKDTNISMIINDSTVNSLGESETLQLYPKFEYNKYAYLNSSCGTWANTSRIADLHIAFRPGTDLALMHAMAWVIINEELDVRQVRQHR